MPFRSSYHINGKVRKERNEQRVLKADRFNYAVKQEQNFILKQWSSKALRKPFFQKNELWHLQEMQSVSIYSLIYSIKE